AYWARYPDVDLVLRTGTTCELIEQVLNYAVEGAFVCGPVNHQDLAEEVFFREELVVLTARTIRSLDPMSASVASSRPTITTAKTAKSRCRSPSAVSALRCKADVG